MDVCRKLRFASAGIGAGALAASMQSSPALAEPLRLVIDDGPFPALDAAPADAARALAAARTDASFGEPRAIGLASGHSVVKLPQVHDGIVVASRGATVSFDARGVPRRLSTAIERELPQTVVPTVGRDDAARAAEAIVRVSVRAERLDLVVWPTAGRARLAWVAYEPRPLLRTAPLVVIDAHTGRVLSAYDAIVELNQAKVWPSNPLTTPELAQVTLPVAEGQTTLTGARHRAFGCIDGGGTAPFGSLIIRVCEPEQTAAADASGDYLMPPGTGSEPEDAFSEVSVFHHVDRGYAFFEQMAPGFTVQAMPLDVVTNLRVATGLMSGDPALLEDHSLPLEPFANAFFALPDPEENSFLGLPGGGLFFGQGAKTDFGYDGDVVYHELGHAVVAATIDLVQTAHADEQGLSAAPGAMNEALADYFSAAITEDPRIGEYAASEFGDIDVLRDLTDDDRCPDAIVGEVHEDATLFSGALWDVRAGLAAADRTTFDAALFEAMVAAPSGDLGYEDLAKLFVQSVEASTLGKPAADALDAAFEKRGVLPVCRRVIEYPAQLQQMYFGSGLGTANIGDAEYAPGVVQFHVTLDDSLPTLLVHFYGVAVGWFGSVSDAPFAPRVLVRFGPEPITFEYDPLVVPSDVIVVPLGGADVEFAANVEVPEGATEAYVMIAQADVLDVLYGNVTIGLGFLGGGPGGQKIMPPKRRPRADDEGCAVRAGAPQADAAAYAGVFLLSLLALRRASRSARFVDAHRR